MLTASERRLRSCDRPISTNERLVDRVEAIREKVLGRARANGSLYVEGVRMMDDGVTLFLHGDIDASTVPHLEAVLEGLVRLQPLQLVIDLSEVGRVSFDALRMINCHGAEVGDLVLRSPSSTTQRDLEKLGATELVESGAVATACA